MNFNESNLGDWLRVEHGFAFKGEHFAEVGKYVVLTPGNFYEAGGFRARPGKDRYYAAAFPKRYLLSKGDLIVAMTEQGEGLLGSAALIPESSTYLHNQRLGLVKERTDIAVRRFLYYLFNSESVRQQIRNSSSGAKVRHTSPERIYDVKVRVPKKGTQEIIAAILSTYDDLIENNQRRIALLEKMAEEIYREWFVRLRFPYYEKTKLVKGTPEDWEVKRVSEVVDFLSGYSFKSETYTPSGNYGVVTIKNVQDGYFIPECSDFIEDVPSNVKRHCYLECGDVLMSLTGNVGRVCHVYGTNLLLNQRVAKLVPKLANSSQFIFHTFNNQNMVQLIENLSLGSTAQMNLSPILLGKQKIIVPSNEMLKKYEDMTIPMFKEKMSLLQRNLLLQKTRDLLLPRLISGKLSVEHLDIQFPPGMEEATHEH